MVLYSLLLSGSPPKAIYHQVRLYDFQPLFLHGSLGENRIPLWISYAQLIQWYFIKVERNAENAGVSTFSKFAFECRTPMGSKTGYCTTTKTCFHSKCQHDLYISYHKSPSSRESQSVRKKTLGHWWMFPMCNGRIWQTRFGPGAGNHRSMAAFQLSFSGDTFWFQPITGGVSTTRKPPHPCPAMACACTLQGYEICLHRSSKDTLKIGRNPTWKVKSSKPSFFRGQLLNFRGIIYILFGMNGGFFVCWQFIFWPWKLFQ